MVVDDFPSDINITGLYLKCVGNSTEGTFYHVTFHLCFSK